MSEIKQALVRQLEKRGIEQSLMPGILRSLSHLLLSHPEISLAEVNQQLQYLGWSDLELDYHTLQLIIACIEEENLPEEPGQNRLTDLGSSMTKPPN